MDFLLDHRVVSYYSSFLCDCSSCELIVTLHRVIDLLCKSIVVKGDRFFFLVLRRLILSPCGIWSTRYALLIVYGRPQAVPVFKCIVFPKSLWACGFALGGGCGRQGSSGPILCCIRPRGFQHFGYVSGFPIGYMRIIA